MQNGCKKALACLLVVLAVFGTVPNLHFISLALSGNQVIEEARKHIGKPYQSGAKGPDSFDCSGLVYYVFSQLGETVQTGSTDGYDSQGIRVDEADVQAGDLVLWYPTAPGRSDGHVGICSGNGKYISALVSPYGVMEDLITNFNNGTKNPPHHYIRLNCLKHIHEFSTFSYYQDEHPHYAVYTCSCGAEQVSTDETWYITACSACASHGSSGSCGADLTWVMDWDTRSLTISGTGTMANFSPGNGNNAPWRTDLPYVMHIIIKDGVTSISDYAFTDGEYDISLPDSLTHIGNHAFSSSRIESIVLPKNVREIGNEAFSWCTYMTSITIPMSLKRIGKAAFGNCEHLKSVHYDGALSQWCQIEKASASANPIYYAETLYMEDKPLTGTINFEQADSIAPYAFTGYDAITNITIPDNVTSIGREAFSGCTNLTDVSIGCGIAIISMNTFAHCQNLERVNIAYGAVKIDSYAFTGCTNLTDITLPNSITEIDSWAFYGCQSLSNIVLPDNLISLEYNAFGDCQSLLKITIPETVRYVGYSAFQDCTNLTDITILPGLYEIGSNTFKNCYNLTSVILPNVGYIGQYAFRNCRSLESIHIPSGTVQISSNAFLNCRNLSYICSDKENCYVQEFAEANNIPFRVCKCHNTTCEHLFESEVTTAPTCTVFGLRTYTCSICGENYTEVIEKTAHIPLVVTETATCMATGKQYTKCSVCGERLSEIVMLPIIPHRFGEWVTIKEATTEEEGLRERTCIYGCGTKETETLVIEKAAQPSIAIRNFTPSTKAYDYRTTLTFAAVVENPVDGASVHWFIDGKDEGPNDTYTKKEAKKNFTVQAKYMQGNTVLAESEIEKVNIKTGFFAKLVAFFRALFGRLPKVVQEYLGVEIIDRVP